jgi:hypothetical protein
VAREAAKLVRVREEAQKAEQAAARALGKQRQKEERDAEKALQLSQKGKRTASKPPIRQKKRARRARGAVSSESSDLAAPTLAPIINSRGRHINRPRRYIGRIYRACLEITLPKDLVIIQLVCSSRASYTE